MTNLKIGDKALPFNLSGVDGKNHSLAEYSGKNAVAVIFSCNHCPYVRAWEDRMVQVQADYGMKGVQLIAINANDASKYPDDSYRKNEGTRKGEAFQLPLLA